MARLIRSAWLKAACAALLPASVLAGCSGIAVPDASAPAASPGASYNELIVGRLQSFNDYASYDAFEISDFRWVHSLKGWSWLTCVRFQDHGQQRTYALYIKEKNIILGRYAVETDGCDARAYSPFAPTNRPARPPSSGLEPLY
jgi:hypothetical protein